MLEIFPINNKKDFDRAVSLVSHIDTSILNENDAVMFEAFIQLIDLYDQKHHSIPKQNAGNILKNLLAMNNLTQNDLADILNTKQPNISAILNGSRKLSLKQATILGKRFNIDSSLFID